MPGGGDGRLPGPAVRRRRAHRPAASVREAVPGAGTWDHRWTDAERGRLREIVAGIRYWTCDGLNERPHALRLDEDRIGEADEAWVPVLTPDGPGMLVWHNSD
ncbi:DUF6210 family protein [Actinomadura hibisca]|uniref:DUF6210 family protein n=1 Tax=Actinomadura hibisca TaxID=68565 RepID=UPI0035A25F8F